MLIFFVGGEECPFMGKVTKEKVDGIVYYKFYIAGLVVFIKCSKSNIQGSGHLLNPNEPAKIYLDSFLGSIYHREIYATLKNHRNSKKLEIIA